MTDTRSSSETAEAPTLVQEALAILKWLREPDYEEKFSLQYTVTWLNRRPVAEMCRVVDGCVGVAQQAREIADAVQPSSSETAYALAFGDICDELKCDHDLNAVLHAIRSRGAAQQAREIADAVQPSSSGSEYAYRFEYADGSAFEVYADGRAFIATKDGRREQKFGKIDNRIPLLVGLTAKPRQDEIDRLRGLAQAAPSRDKIAVIIQSKCADELYIKDDHTGDEIMGVGPASYAAADAIRDLLVSSTSRCTCQDQHRRGYCTEPGCPYAHSSTAGGSATK